MTPGTIDDRRDAALGDRRRKSGLTIERVLLIATFVCSLTAFVFGVGVQWAKTTAVEATVQTVMTNYLPREIYNGDQKHVAEALDRLTKSIDKMNEQRDADERLRRSAPGFVK